MLHTLDAESTRLLVDSRLQEPDIVNLRLIKARKNLKRMQELGLNQEEVMDAEDRLLSVEYNLESSTKNTPNNGDTEHIPDEYDELNMLSSEVKQRQVHKTGNIDLQQQQQQQLSEDLLEMAAAIKRNAQTFQAKLDADNDLVSQTGDALQRTAGTMGRVGSKLTQYRRDSIGWRFYIASALFIFVVAFLGMFVIQIFGKW